MYPPTSVSLPRHGTLVTPSGWTFPSDPTLRYHTAPGLAIRLRIVHTGAAMSKQAVAASPDYANRVSILEAAVLLGVSPITIRRRIKDGTLPAVIVAGRYRITRTDLDLMVRSAA